MNDLRTRAIKFLQRRFPTAVVLDRTHQLKSVLTGLDAKPVHFMIALDPDVATKQGLLATPKLGNCDEVPHLSVICGQILADLKAQLEIRYGHIESRSASIVSTERMADSPKLVVYTDASDLPGHEVVWLFEQAGHLIELIKEAEMHKSVFISYGGPDEQTAKNINQYLKSQGVQTWFFPDDAVAGDKLHRVMSNGVVNHDRVLLICSQASLSRVGVLNEIERVLEREAREGGSDILIPITIDDYVFSSWAPSRPDIAHQIRSRVIAKFPSSGAASAEFTPAADKTLGRVKEMTV